MHPVCRTQIGGNFTQRFSGDTATDQNRINSKLVCTQNIRFKLITDHDHIPGAAVTQSRLEDGGFLALSRECTHLGCTVPWLENEKRFACPCHASVFDIRGEVVNAPASRPLDIYPVFIENNIVKVDTDKRIKRSGFDIEQVVYGK